MADLELQMRGQRLVTAEILYHMPDHPRLLQTFLWQDYDVAPAYPALNRFLGFWVDKIEGRLHSVYVARQKLIGPGEFRAVDGAYLVH